MNHRSFVPRVSRLLPQEVEDVPGLEAVISYWSRGSWPAEEWLRRAVDGWGSAGLVSRRGDKVLGFCVFGPQGFFPRADSIPVSLSDDAVLLAYVAGDRRTKKHLLVRMLKELRDRGTSAVEAVAGDFHLRGHVSTRCLLEAGWQPLDRVYYRGRACTLMRAELGAAIEIGELARRIIGRVRLPSLKNASPEPSALYPLAGPHLEWQYRGFDRRKSFGRSRLNFEDDPFLVTGGGPVGVFSGVFERGEVYAGLHRL